MPQFKVTAHPTSDSPHVLRAWVIVTADSPKEAREIARPTLSADFWGEPFRITKTERRRDTVNPSTFTSATSWATAHRTPSTNA